MNPCMLAALALTALLAYQSGDAAKPQFEVASVKLVNRPVEIHPYYLKISHGNLAVDAVPLKFIIGLAYKTTQIQGGPGWMSDERYDIQAKSGNPNATKEEIRTMLQALLADRFNLALHKETRQLSLYTLVVGKGGPKFKEANDDEQAGVSTSADSVNFQATPMAGLATTLRGLLKTPVVDRTGLAGRYDFELDYMPPRPGAADSGPSLFTAVEELGLKLEAGKGPVEIMVIDRVDHASEN